MRYCLTLWEKLPKTIVIMNTFDFFFFSSASTFTVIIEEESLQTRRIVEMFKICVLVIKWESSVCKVK